MPSHFSSEVVFKGTKENSNYILKIRIQNVQVFIHLHNKTFPKLKYYKIKSFIDLPSCIYFFSSITLNIKGFEVISSDFQTPVSPQSTSFETRVQSITTEPQLCFCYTFPNTSTCVIFDTIILKPGRDEMDSTKLLSDTESILSDDTDGDFQPTPTLPQPSTYSSTFSPSLPAPSSISSAIGGSTPPKTQNAPSDPNAPNISPLVPHVSLDSVFAGPSLKHFSPFQKKLSLNTMKSCRFIQLMSKNQLISVIRDYKSKAAHCLIINADDFSTKSSFPVGTNIYHTSISHSHPYLYIFDQTCLNLSIFDVWKSKKLFTKRYGSQLQSIMASQDGSLVALGFHCGIIQITNTLLEAQYELNFIKHAVSALQFSSDSKLLYCGDESGTVTCFDLTLRKISFQKNVHRYRIYHINVVNGVIFTCSRDRTIKKLDTNMNISTYTGFAQRTLCSFVMGNYLFGTCRDGSVRIYDLQTGHAVQVLRHSDAVFQICSIDYNTIVTASQNKSITKWQS